MDLIKYGALTLGKYGADVLDLYYTFYLFVGLIPMTIYCIKFNNIQNSIVVNISIQLIRLLIFFISFFIYCRYGFMNTFIQYNALLLMVYTIVVYYYWVHKDLLETFNPWVCRTVAYVFYLSILSELSYLGYKTFW